MFITSYMSEYSTIRISKTLKKKLDELKVHPREPYNDVINRLIEKCEKSN